MSSLPTSVVDLINAFEDEWSKIPTATLQNLVENIPRSVKLSITAKGDWIWDKHNVWQQVLYEQ